MDYLPWFLLIWLVVMEGASTYSTTSSRPPKPTVKPYVKMDHLKLQSVAEQPNALVWIDVENVRGKSGFELSHMDLIEKATTWTKYHKLEGKVNLVVDHGTVTSGYWLEERGLSVVFSGNSQKADDVIARDVALFGEQVVVTADNELQRRCKRSSRNSLHIMNPMKFIDDLEYAAVQLGKQELLEDQQAVEPIDEIDDNEGETDGDDTANSSTALDDEILLGNMDAEIRLGGQLLEAESILRSKKNITNKRRKKLEKRVHDIKEKLATRGPSMLGRVTTLLGGKTDNGMSQKDQDLLLSRWQEIRNKPARREQTGDRVILAERLRRSIVDSGEGVKSVEDYENENFPVKAHVRHMNGCMSPDRIKSATSKSMHRFKMDNRSQDSSVSSAPTSTVEVVSHDLPNGVPSTKQGIELESNGSVKTLTLVAVSDTHGFEHQFADQEGGSDILPNGDVLLHLGDYAVDGTFEDCYTALQNFDEWLAKQPHKYKIVVRGNHDPWNFDFEKSGALYVTNPQTLKIGDLTFALVPYGSSRKLASQQGFPKECDVFASHVPPFKSLDHCLAGKHAGSGFLNRIVAGMRNQPHLWLCGHIHEGRGMKRRRFGKGRETIVINASNANPGRAVSLVHGPVVLKLDSAGDNLEILMEDESIGRGIESESTFFETPSGDNREMLMAVDLGLRSGISLFNNHGELVRYEQFHFSDELDLEDSAGRLLEQWEHDVNKDTSNENEALKPWRVTHIAIEGADPGMRNAWSRVAQTREQELSLLCISPEEWRAHLLTKKEKASGSSAKEAARLIARQVVADFGSMEVHKGKFKTDVAESVVMGVYVARKLGWVKREPAVRRYTNDRIVVPKSIGTA